MRFKDWFIQLEYMMPGALVNPTDYINTIGVASRYQGPDVTGEKSQSRVKTANFGQKSRSKKARLEFWRNIHNDII